MYTLVLGDGDPGDPRGWVAAFAATLLLDVLGAFTISAAISLHGGGWDWTELRDSIVEGAAAAVGNTSLALVAVLVLERDVRAAWLLIVVAAILHVAYRAYTGLGHGHARASNASTGSRARSAGRSRPRRCRRRSWPTPAGGGRPLRRPRRCSTTGSGHATVVLMDDVGAVSRQPTTGDGNAWWSAAARR